MLLPPPPPVPLNVKIFSSIRIVMPIPTAAKDVHIRDCAPDFCSFSPLSCGFKAVIVSDELATGSFRRGAGRVSIPQKQCRRITYLTLSGGMHGYWGLTVLGKALGVRTFECRSTLTSYHKQDH